MPDLAAVLPGCIDEGVLSSTRSTDVAESAEEFLAIAARVPGLEDLPELHRQAFLELAREYARQQLNQ